MLSMYLVNCGPEAFPIFTEDTPTSLTCPRTPTSIRAAPWQPTFTPTPSTTPGRNTPIPGSNTPTPRPTPIPRSPTPVMIPDIPSSGSNTPTLKSILRTPTPTIKPDTPVRHTPTPTPAPPTTQTPSPTPIPYADDVKDAVTPTLPPLVTTTPLTQGVTPEQMSPKGGPGQEGSREQEPPDLLILDDDPRPSFATLDVTQLHADLGMGGKGQPPNSPSDTNNSITSIDFDRPPLDGPVKMAELEGYRAYPARFWILATFSLLAFLQSMVWGTWAPIVDSAQEAFGWSDAMVAAFPNWGPVVVVLFTIPMMWLTQKMGLRLGVVACAALICAGTLVRCFSSEPEVFTVLCHVGAVLNSFAACMTLALPAMVAAVWFPPDERITATAVGALMAQLGGAAMYLEPLVVRSPAMPATPPSLFIQRALVTPQAAWQQVTPQARRRTTTPPPWMFTPPPRRQFTTLPPFYGFTTPFTPFGDVAPPDDVTPAPPNVTEAPITPEDIRGDIMTLMYIHFGLAAVLLLAVASYFPGRPPTPPSASSAEEKSDFASGIKSIVRNVQLLLVLGVYAFSFGVPVVWIGVLTLSLRLVDVNQEQAMGVAVVAVVVSSAAAFIAARITDKMYGHLRNTVICLLLGSAACFLWFMLLSTRTVEPTLGQVYVSVTGAVSLEYASVPLLVELAVELGYPIPESVTGAALTFLFNVVALIFLGLFQIPSDYLWVSYVLLASVTLSIVPLLFVKETHKRSQTDRKI